MDSTPSLFPDAATPPPRPPRLFDLWVEAGQQFTKQHDRLQWKIGDWLAEGQRAYGEKIAYAHAEKVTGKKRQTLYQFASVAKRVPDCMRHTNLSWEHHQVVAALESEHQKAWLDAAEERNLSAKQLRQAVAGKIPPKAGLPPSQMPHDWKFYRLPLHIEDFEKLEALAHTRKLQRASVGVKEVAPPMRLAHQIILEYMAAHA